MNIRKSFHVLCVAKDNMETIVILIFVVVFILVFGMIAKGVFNSIAEKRYNDSQPVLTKDVKISGKRSEVSGSKNTSVRTSYYATFEFVEDKNRLELEVEDEDYGLMAEGDSGKLTFQGRRYHKFERTFVEEGR